MLRLIAVTVAIPLAATGCGGQDRGPAAPADPEVTLGTSAPRAAPRSRQRASTPRRPSRRPAAVARPRIKRRLIPFPSRRREETAAYAKRHYGKATAKLDPKVIVEHVSVTPTLSGVYNTFAADKPDVELHELPGVCSHFVIDRDGTIYQLVPLTLICGHTVGLNDVAFGIEHVGSTDADVLGDSAQMAASLRLTTWLRCRYGIAIKNVIGHAESLSSPYHHELVARLRNQTHSDWQPQSMRRYRRLLSRRRCNS